MIDQTTIVSELSSADFAGKRHFSSMNSSMGLEVVFSSESLSTILANMLGRVGMRLLMSLEVVMRSESLRTDMTLMRSLGLNEFEMFRHFFLCGKHLITMMTNDYLVFILLGLGIWIAGNTMLLMFKIFCIVHYR